MTACDFALPAPSQPADSLEALLPAERDRLLLGLAGKLHRLLGAPDQNLGHVEEQLLRGGHGLFRPMLEEADHAPSLCPQNLNTLRRLAERHWATIQIRLVSIRPQRTRGCCKRCRKWRFPANGLLEPAEG